MRLLGTPLTTNPSRVSIQAIRDDLCIETCLVTPLLCCHCSVILISTAALADSLEQAAASEWQNHVYTLRVWVGGDNIETDENGRVLHGGSPVSWTQARFEVQKVSVHRDKIEFRGNRVGLLYDKDKGQFVK